MSFTFTQIFDAGLLLITHDSTNLPLHVWCSQNLYGPTNLSTSGARGWRASNT